ncbi:MAG: hypothetical protein ACJASC_000771 [Limimaricola cinnabarinus]|jgi:hypothetical protein
MAGLARRVVVARMAESLFMRVVPVSGPGGKYRANIKKAADSVRGTVPEGGREESSGFARITQLGGR